MKLPEHVIEVKNHFVKTKDERMKIMCKLTEPKDLSTREALEYVWKNIFNAEKRRDGAKSSEWVLLFINSVSAAKTEMPYFSMDKNDCNALLGEIEKYSRKLEKLYKRLGFDEPFFVYDPNLLVEEERLNEENWPSMGISDVLNFYQDIANCEIKNFMQFGKLDNRHVSRRFIKILADRNVARYNKQLLGVLKNAAYAIYSHTYKEADISAFLKDISQRKNKIPLESRLIKS